MSEQVPPVPRDWAEKWRDSGLITLGKDDTTGLTREEDGPRGSVTRKCLTCGCVFFAEARRLQQCPRCGRIVPYPRPQESSLIAVLPLQISRFLDITDLYRLGCSSALVLYLPLTWNVCPLELLLAAETHQRYENLELVLRWNLESGGFPETSDDESIPPCNCDACWGDSETCTRELWWGDSD